MMSIISALAAATLTLAPVPSGAVSADSGGNRLYVCSADAAAKRALKRTQGEVVFVTAKEVLAAQGSGERWASPRCITNHELRRLKSQTQRLVQINAAR
ncbi:MAG: hypothetical protein KAG62_16280 [Caulobacter sp.]|jgi:hypothetical protein|uniref:hypothetical protein n=1 Tax=Caulobacter sp. CCH9-E1 TaxID=1768768 RepID=UPI000835268E|nr:hypothetical protein [Caulobacter sp. CCH9-E1]MCK5911504.1 hypothetical protein [Caulobacter sp.]